MRPAEAEVLIRAGADCLAKDKYGFTPLHSAALINNDKVADVLLKAGVDPDVVATGDLEGQTALHCAATMGQPHVARVLLLAGANPNAEDAFGYTPLDSTRDPLGGVSSTGQEMVAALLLKAQQGNT